MPDVITGTSEGHRGDWATEEKAPGRQEQDTRLPAEACKCGMRRGPLETERNKERILPGASGRVRPAQALTSARRAPCLVPASTAVRRHTCVVSATVFVGMCSGHRTDLIVLLHSFRCPLFLHDAAGRSMTVRGGRGTGERRWCPHRVAAAPAALLHRLWAPSSSAGSSY